MEGIWGKVLLGRLHIQTSATLGFSNNNGDDNVAEQLSCHVFSPSPQSLASLEAKTVDNETWSDSKCTMKIELMGFADKLNVGKRKRDGSRMKI